MTDAVCAAVLAVILFAVLAPPLGRRLPPALATRLLVPASLAMAASTMFVLGALGFTWLAQLPFVAALGPWSASQLDATDPVPDPLAIASLVLLAAATTWAVVFAVRRVRALLRVHRTYRDLGAQGPAVVVAAARPDAFTTPAPAGRIIVTAPLWDALCPDERRVVLLHERSHLAHRHIWWTLAAELATAINPLLRPTSAMIDHTVERWADEDAAGQVGDRGLVARTIARAALLQHEANRPGRLTASAAATGGDVPRRVRALLAPPPPRRPFALAVLTVVVLACGAGTLAVERTSDGLFDQAGRHVIADHWHHQPLVSPNWFDLPATDQHGFA